MLNEQNSSQFNRASSLAVSFQQSEHDLTEEEQTEHIGFKKYLIDIYF